MTKRMATKRTHAQIVRFQESREKKIAYKNMQNRLTDLYGENIIINLDQETPREIARIIIFSWSFILVGLGIVFLLN